MSTRDDLIDAALTELDGCGHAGVSLRAVARRAGVSHAAPKNHFGDRAGLLTAVATRGFTELADAMGAVDKADPALRLRALAAAYVGFGLARPALFDLMFRPSELHPDDPDLQAAGAASIADLGETAGDLARDGLPAPTLTTMAWALVHGLVVLARDGLLAPGGSRDDAAAAAREVTDAVSAMLGHPSGASGDARGSGR